MDVRNFLSLPSSFRNIVMPVQQLKGNNYYKNCKHAARLGQRLKIHLNYDIEMEENQEILLAVSDNHILSNKLE